MAVSSVLIAEVVPVRLSIQGLYSLSSKMSYYQLSSSVKAVRYGFSIV